MYNIVVDIDQEQNAHQQVRPQHSIIGYIQLSFHDKTHRKLFFDTINSSDNLWNEVGSKGWHPAIHETLNDIYKGHSV